MPVTRPQPVVDAEQSSPSHGLNRIARISAARHNRRRSALRRGHSRGLRHRRVELSPSAGGRGDSAARGRRDCGALGRARKLDAAARARRRHQPRGASVQCGAGARFLQVHESRPRHRPRRARRPGRTRRRPEPSQRRARAARTVLRARSFDQGSMHDRRDDRQQLMRRAFGRVRQDGRQRRGARGHPLRRHAAFADGLDGRGAARHGNRARRARRRSLLARPRAARPLRRFSARTFPETAAARVGLQPRRADAGARLQSCARNRRFGGHARSRFCARRFAQCRARTRSRWPCSDSTTFSSRRIKCRGCSSIARRRSKASTRICRNSRASRRCRVCGFCPPGARFCSSSSAARRATKRASVPNA